MSLFVSEMGGSMLNIRKWDSPCLWGVEKTPFGLWLPFRWESDSFSLFDSVGLEKSSSSVGPLCRGPKPWSREVSELLSATVCAGLESDTLTPESSWLLRVYWIVPHDIQKNTLPFLRQCRLFWNQIYGIRILLKLQVKVENKCKIRSNSSLNISNSFKITFLISARKTRQIEMQKPDLFVLLYVVVCLLIPLIWSN